MFPKVSNKIYLCRLATITKDSTIYTDLSMKENIKNARKEIIKEIMVQKTFSKKYVRELVTGKIFPVYRYGNYRGNSSEDILLVTYQEVPNYMVFAYIKEDRHYGNVQTYLFEANDLEVLDYLDQHPDKKLYLKELNDLCKEREQLYLESKSQNIVSSRGKVKQKLK